MDNRKRRIGKRNLAIIALVLMLAVPASFASVFVYHPINLSITQTKPPIIFQPGTNAGQADVNGTIDVEIGANQTSASITLHPTYQTTLYEDILEIVNKQASQSYNVYIRVVTPASVPSGATAELIVNGVTVDLTTAGDTYIGTINANTTWTVGAKFYFPEGNPLTSTSASIQLIYTPGSETPP